MKFVLTVDLDNDAFQDGQLTEELAAILKHAAGLIRHQDKMKSRLLDVNGNSVGEYYVEESD